MQQGVLDPSWLISGSTLEERATGSCKSHVTDGCHWHSRSPGNGQRFNAKNEKFFLDVCIWPEHKNGSIMNTRSNRWGKKGKWQIVPTVEFWVFWVVMTWRVVVEYHRFGGSCSHHL